MLRRPSTQLSQLYIVESARAVLELAPAATLDYVVERIPYSGRSVQRAFAAQGTSFIKDRRRLQLDRAAKVLLDEAGRGRRVSLLNAARAAGGWQPRHLCGPFRRQFGMTPGAIWSVGKSLRELEGIGRAPLPHSRREPAAYARRRRRVMRLQAQLRLASHALTPGTLVAGRVASALSQAVGGKGPTASSPRRARRRARAHRDARPEGRA